MKNSILCLLFSIIAFVSCKKELPEIGGTAAEKLSGEWWVRLYGPDGSTVYPEGYRGHLYTYNTAANGGEIWIDDYSDPLGQILWDFKIKAQADLNSLTFKASDAMSVVPSYPIKVTVADGKVLPLGGKSKSGVVVDSIFMHVEFSDDPGTIYTISGHQRSGFLEDEY